MRRLAIRSVLSAKVAEGSLRVLDALAFDRPRTKEMVSLLQTLGLERSTLVVTESADRGVLVSARNLEKINVLAASYLNVGDMLSHQNLLMTVGAIRQAERLWGGDRATRRRAPIPEPETAVQALPAPRARRRRTAPVPLEAPVAEKPAPRRRRVASAPAEAPAPEKPAPRRRRTAAAPKAEAPTPEEGAANA
jgi:hypothetical protein